MFRKRTAFNPRPVTLVVDSVLQPPPAFIYLIHPFNWDIQRAELAWHLSTVLWVDSAIYYNYVAWFLFKGMNLALMGAVFIPATLVNMAFITYFQSERVKTYFKASVCAQKDA